MTLLPGSLREKVGWIDYYEMRERLETITVHRFVSCLSWLQIIVLGAVSYTVFCVLRAIYNLFFHPLQKFPGPKLAAVSDWHTFWYEIPKDGILTRHLYHNLRPKYGPIIRIAPDTLWISDPSAYHQIHSVGSPFIKSKKMYARLGMADMVPGIIDPARAKNRRQAMSKMFSRASAREWNGVVRAKLEKLSGRLDEEVWEGERIVDMKAYFSAFIADVVMKFAMAEDLGCCDATDLKHPMVESMHVGTNGLLFIRNFPVLLHLQKLPLWALKHIAPLLYGMHNIEQKLQTKIAAFQAEDQLQEKYPQRKASSNSHPNEFKSMYTEVADRYAENGYPEKLAGDLASLFTAGLTTTFWILSTAHYYLALNPAVQQNLYEELKSAWPDRNSPIPAWDALEKLPYLTGVFKEALRLGYGVVGSLWRVAPPSGIEVAGHFIPGNTEVETDCYSIHMNPDIFASPTTFSPERWIASGGTKELDRWLVSFSSGSRSCLGQQLAELELYSALACFGRRFEFGLTKDMEREGWQWNERWIPVKIGAPISFKVKRRED